MTDVVDQELDRLSSRRASTDTRTAADEREELWKASVRAHNAKIRRANRAAWYGWHLDQAARHRRNLEDLIAHHEAQATKLLEG
jgi:hypothetical protein